MLQSNDLINLREKRLSIGLENVKKEATMKTSKIFPVASVHNLFTADHDVFSTTSPCFDLISNPLVLVSLSMC